MLHQSCEVAANTRWDIMHLETLGALVPKQLQLRWLRVGKLKICCRLLSAAEDQGSEIGFDYVRMIGGYKA